MGLIPGFSDGFPSVFEIDDITITTRRIPIFYLIEPTCPFLLRFRCAFAVLSLRLAAFTPLCFLGAEALGLRLWMKRGVRVLTTSETKDGFFRRLALKVLT